jgi:hypothetical protein
MIAGRSPLAIICTALAFGFVLAPYYFLGVLLQIETPLRYYVLLALIACSLFMVLRLSGWSKLDSWLARQNPAVRLLIHAITAVACLYSLAMLIFAAAFGGFTSNVVGFNALVALAICTVIALVPIFFLKPFSFERAFTSHLGSRLRLATYAAFFLLAAFACLQVVNYYHVNHPVY